ncbi:MAG: redoxin domain-containing protein [Ignavibacteria bacterium]|nr:redoxin domain-containing protein [Ignavibacteria bacterium]
MDTKRLFQGNQLYSIALHIVIVALGFELFVLARQNEELKERREMFAVGSLKVGDAFNVRNLSPVSTTKDAPAGFGGRHVVFVFSATCRYCKANIEMWQRIALEGKKHNVVVYAVSVDSLLRTSRYVKENPNITYDVYVPSDIREFAKENRVSGVPITILRSPLGIVEDYWLGALSAKELEEILGKLSST